MKNDGFSQQEYRRFLVGVFVHSCLRSAEPITKAELFFPEGFEQYTLLRILNPDLASRARHKLKLILKPYKTLTLPTLPTMQVLTLRKGLATHCIMSIPKF